MNENITINNACRFYNCALDNVDRQKSQVINRFIREHFTSLHESGLLSELSLKNFTTIIEHDEINIRNEDEIFSSAVQTINQQTPLEDIKRCLELIRFAHTSGDFHVKVRRNHPVMKEPSRHTYVSEAMLYQENKSHRITQDVKPPRYWCRSGIYYISKDHCMYQYVPKAGNHECVKMIDLPEWVGHGSYVASHRERVVIVEGFNFDKGDKRALLLDMTDNTTETKLPNLPELRDLTCVVLSDNDVYVVGEGKCVCRSSVYYLSFGSSAWQIKKSMSRIVKYPFVIHHKQCIYVLGGYNTNGSQSSSVSQFNIKDDTWKQCSDMPVACNSDGAGIVVHEGIIKVITPDKCLVYADDTDTWIVKSYNKLGNAINPIVRRGQICAVVSNDDKTFSTVSYDDVDNVWKTEHEKIDFRWNMRFFW